MDYDDDIDIFDSGLGALDVGAGYALARHGQDVQTAAIVDAIRAARIDSDIPAPIQTPVEIHVHTDEDERGVPVVNVLDFADVDMPDDWDDYIGQAPLKQQIAIYMASARKRGKRLPHMLLASGYPGVGKTTMSRLVAVTMDCNIIELVPPFNVYTLVEAAKQLEDGDILFIDEIHKLADSGKRGAELLLKVLEEGVAFLPDGTVEVLPDITIIGATTDRDKLPEPVVDRFKIKPYFQAYSEDELAQITVQFAFRHGLQDAVDDWMAANIAMASRGTPRITEEAVLACGALADAMGRNPTPDEVLAFLEVEPDGLTRQHIHYLTALRQYFPRTVRDTEEIEYIVGAAAIQQILRETDNGLSRIEGFLVERGLIDRTPRGRRLTDAGILRAEEFIAAGKGAVLS